jgi:formylglycine-generating enzyme required for sulfatase activity
LFTVAVGCNLSGPEDDSGNSDDSNGDSDDGDDSNGDTVIDIAAIPGVTVPVIGETPVTTITETSQYTGTVSWSPADDPFEALTVYTANITLTAKSGYTLSGVSADFFTVAGANTVANDADSGVVTAEFPATEAGPPDVIDIAAIPGVTVPVIGETPVTTITETSQYTGTVSWSPADTTFAGSTVYTATITLTAKTGYTLTGVSADFFTVAGATSVTNDADSGVVTAVFPETAAAAEESSGFDSATTPGDTGVLTLNGSSETITMIYANDSDAIAYPITLDDDDNFAWLNTRFWISETEVTNAVMAAVLQWAYDNGRFSTTVSDHNGLDTSTAKFGGKQLLDLDDPDCRVDYNGSGDFTAESGFEFRPVTNITWYGAIKFCNWLTEMRDGNTSNVVYAGIDTNWTDDETTETITKNGYRLFSGDEWSDEWEYAARYRGTDPVNTVSDFPSWDPGPPYFTQGDSASGATADYNDDNACRAVAVYSGQLPTPTDEAVVRSLWVNPNTLGIYDMSGNVWEWGFTEDDDDRVIRGGSWNQEAGFLRVGFAASVSPSSESGSIGFRLYRTQPAD